MPSPSKRRVQTVGISEARDKLGALVERVRPGKAYVIIEKAGVPRAGVMDIDEFEDYLELRDVEIARDIAASAREHSTGKGRPARKLQAELDAIAGGLHKPKG